jgi:hypothetical protein
MGGNTEMIGGNRVRTATARYRVGVLQQGMTVLSIKFEEISSCVFSFVD